MSQQANILTRAGWEFISAKKRGMFKLVFWREPVRIDGRHRMVIPQRDAYAWHAQNRRNKLAVYQADLTYSRGRTGWRVLGADSTVALAPPEPVSAVDSTK